MAAADSDMRLIIAGAGGRMGRTLLHAIGATKGVTLAGAVEAADSAVIGRDAGDQKRVMTPSAAIAAGADYLVVGRPIVAAADPRAAAQAIVAEIAQQART